MNNTLTNSEQRISENAHSDQHLSIGEGARIFLPVLMAALILATLIIGSVGQNNLYLTELLTGGFIVMFVVIIRAAEGYSTAKYKHSQRN